MRAVLIFFSKDVRTIENPQKKAHDKDPLYEEIDEDEMHELVLEAQREALLKASLEETEEIPRTRFPKWIFWLIATFMLLNTFSIVFEVYSIPAVDFLKTSTKLSADEQIKTYKKSVVVITTADSKGTGFSITSDGTILTNDHVVAGNNKVTVLFPDHGSFTANVVATYPSIDLAVLEVNGQDLPHLQLAEKTIVEEDESIYFIGNPLGFHGIANEGTIIDYIQLENWQEEVIMMKAPVYRGNSGSPVINKKGEVIGIVFATLNADQNGKVGLFVPIDYYYDMQDRS